MLILRAIVLFRYYYFYWPNERRNLDSTKNGFLRLIKVMQTRVMLVRDEHFFWIILYFKTRFLVLIDYSRRDDNTKSATVNITLDIEAKENFPDKTNAFCLFIYDCPMQYLPLSETVRSLD